MPVLKGGRRHPQESRRDTDSEDGEELDEPIYDAAARRSEVLGSQ